MAPHDVRPPVIHRSTASGRCPPGAGVAYGVMLEPQVPAAAGVQAVMEQVGEI
jgi:hypothetical protein